MGVVLIKWHTI